MSSVSPLQPRVPRVRASYVKHVLECVSGLPEADSTEIRNRVGPFLAAVRDATPVDWLSYQAPLALVSAADEVLGREGMRALYVAAMRSTFRGRLLGPLFSAVAKLFELAPERILRSAPAGFANIWRDAGDVVVVSAESGRVVLQHAPIPEPLRAPAFLAATAASFEAVPVECGRSTARSEATLEGEGTVRYSIWW
jgi:hypothetical protein